MYLKSTPINGVFFFGELNDVVLDRSRSVWHIYTESRELHRVWKVYTKTRSSRNQPESGPCSFRRVLRQNPLHWWLEMTSLLIKTTVIREAKKLIYTLLVLYTSILHGRT